MKFFGRDGIGATAPSAPRCSLATSRSRATGETRRHPRIAHLPASRILRLHAARNHARSRTQDIASVRRRHAMGTPRKPSRFSMHTRGNTSSFEWLEKAIEVLMGCDDGAQPSAPDSQSREGGAGLTQGSAGQGGLNPWRAATSCGHPSSTANSAWARILPWSGYEIAPASS